ncbi:hypothetical protein K435DRAFT_874797 [Dendrothele bispora CBS 962.96]|uniref:Uncharacterized protein n=1 Tax=Dendrothele bispora (strain CBS 962.96) TaxID=1314807 RepID=A0A4S8KW57_DENBC|nr:hypothetical protein K435DRAFT_874797 [Dendrothele bispora CBS 962.96]
MWSRTRKGKNQAAPGFKKVSLSSVLGESSTPVVHAESLSSDGRRVKRSIIPVDEPPSPVKRLRQVRKPDTISQLTDQVFGDAFESILSKIYDDDDLALAVDRGTSNIVVVEEVRNRRRYLSSDQPLKEWIPYRDEYLAELLRLEGRGDVEKDECPWCGQPSEDEDGEHIPFYRCVHCFGEDLMCKACCVKRHEANPLHVIEVRNISIFRICLI